MQSGTGEPRTLRDVQDADRHGGPSQVEVAVSIVLDGFVHGQPSRHPVQTVAGEHEGAHPRTRVKPDQAVAVEGHHAPYGTQDLLTEGVSRRGSPSLFDELGPSDAQGSAHLAILPEPGPPRSGECAGVPRRRG